MGENIVGRETQAFPKRPFEADFRLPAKVVFVFQRRLHEGFVVKAQMFVYQRVFAKKPERGTPSLDFFRAVVFGVVVSVRSKIGGFVHARQGSFQRVIGLADKLTRRASASEITEVNFSPKIRGNEGHREGVNSLMLPQVEEVAVVKIIVGFFGKKLLIAKRVLRFECLNGRWREAEIGFQAQGDGLDVARLQAACQRGVVLQKQGVALVDLRGEGDTKNKAKQEDEVSHFYFFKHIGV